jgi:carboxypeptidase Q
MRCERLSDLHWRLKETDRQTDRQTDRADRADKKGVEPHPQTTHQYQQPLNYQSPDHQPPTPIPQIVLLNPQCDWAAQPVGCYGQLSQYRGQGASKAAEWGAVACLVRSLASSSIGSPHTGMQSYLPDVVRRIPAAAVAVEDADAMARMQARGQRITVSLYMEGACACGWVVGWDWGDDIRRPDRTMALMIRDVRLSLFSSPRPPNPHNPPQPPPNDKQGQNLPPAPSHNVVAEWRGAERPEEVIILSGHLDSWDVGAGAMDDGGGVAIAWQALSALRALGLRAKRTVRLVLWTCEEFGGVGACCFCVFLPVLCVVWGGVRPSVRTETD